MTRRIALPILLLASGLLVAGARGPAPLRAQKKKPDLVLRARVTKIFVNALPRSRYNWVIQTRVLKVLRGRFTSNRFEFRVHSPSRSNLSVGKTITIHAWRVQGGYFVDPNRIY